MFNDEPYRNAVLGYSERRQAARKDDQAMSSNDNDASERENEQTIRRVKLKQLRTGDLVVCKRDPEPHRFNVHCDGAVRESPPATPPTPDRNAGEWSRPYYVKGQGWLIADKEGAIVQARNEATAAQIVADHAAVPRLAEALGLAAKRIDFLTNWIENTYEGTNADVNLGRRYAEAVREAIRLAAMTTQPAAGEE